MSAVVVRATYGDATTRLDVTAALAKRVEELKSAGATRLVSSDDNHGFAPQLFGADPTPRKAKYLECTVRYASGSVVSWTVREFGCRWAETKSLALEEPPLSAANGGGSGGGGGGRGEASAESKTGVADVAGGPGRLEVAKAARQDDEKKMVAEEEEKEETAPFDTELHLPIDEQAASTDFAILDLPEGRVYSFACPRCGGGVTVPIDGAGVNCGIYRHAMFKFPRAAQQANPHASMEECRRLVRSGQIDGCGKPFAFNGKVLKKCDYKLPHFR